MYHMHSGLHRCLKRMLETWKLESQSQKIESCHLSRRKWMWILDKSIKWSYSWAISPVPWLYFPDTYNVIAQTLTKIVSCRWSLGSTMRNILAHDRKVTKLFLSNISVDKYILLIYTSLKQSTSYYCTLEYSYYLILTGFF